jgi:hypothetical protein
MTGLMDKTIAKVNQNELDWYENFFNTAYSVYKNNRLFSDCTFLLEIQKFKISNFTQWCNRQYKQVQFSNCVCKYQMFKKRTGQVGFYPGK